MMKYTWNTITQYGQYEHGFVYVYTTTINNKKLYAILNYLPQFENQDQKVLVTLLIEGEKQSWTSVVLKSVFYDCEDTIKEFSNFRFRVFNRLDYMTVQTFYFKKIDNIEFGINGDFGFI